MSGLGVVIAEMFPWSRVDGKFVEPPAHLAAAVLIVFATALGLIVFSHRMKRDPAWRDHSTYTLCSGLGMLVLSFTVGSLAKGENMPLHQWLGLQRVLCGVWFTWIVLNRSSAPDSRGGPPTCRSVLTLRGIEDAERRSERGG